MSEKFKIKIGIDMDQVITDTLKKQIVLYNDLFGKNLKREELMGKKIYQLMNLEEKSKFINKMNSKGFYRDLIPIEGSLEIIEILSKIYDIYIVTAAMAVPNSMMDKYMWLRENLGFIDAKKYIFCGDKSAVATDYLIDDNVEMLEKFRYKKILYTAPSNICENRFTRADNWMDIKNIFM